MEDNEKLIVKGYQPHPAQAFLHEKMINGGEFYDTFNIGRQWGKTMMLINQMFYWGFNIKGIDIGFISPTLKQSRRVLYEMIKFAGKSNLLLFNRSELSVTFKNGSKIQFLSSEQGDAIRGFHFHIVVRDESAYMPNGYYHEIVAPMLLVKGFKDVSISTPKGRSSDHFKRYVQAQDNDLYFSYTAPSSSNPFMNKEILEDIRLQTPDYIWRQEYLAEFLDGGTLFKNVSECIMEGAKPSDRNYGGLDIGRADDYTVLTILNQSGQVVFCDRWRHDEWKAIITKVVEKIVHYNAFTLIEVNNQGDVFYENVRDQLRDKRMIKEFTTTAKSKPNIIENLIMAFEQKSITIPKIEWLKMELESFTFVYNEKSRKIRYGAPSGLHDDGVMSLAIANECLLHHKSKGNYTFGY